MVWRVIIYNSFPPWNFVSANWGCIENIDKHKLLHKPDDLVIVGFWDLFSLLIYLTCFRPIWRTVETLGMLRVSNSGVPKTYPLGSLQQRCHIYRIASLERKWTAANYWKLVNHLTYRSKPSATRPLFLSPAACRRKWQYFSRTTCPQVPSLSTFINCTHIWFKTQKDEVRCDHSSHWVWLIISISSFIATLQRSWRWICRWTLQQRKWAGGSVESSAAAHASSQQYVRKGSNFVRNTLVS